MSACRTSATFKDPILGSTIFDTIHKKSAKYFFQAAEKSKKSQTRSISGGEKTSIAVKTAVNEVMLSSEFCNARRRIAHLLGMYGFVMFLITTIILIFSYPTSATNAPALVTGLWHIGALMVAVGGYWFWFFIRVDVSAEGHSPFRLMRADLFVVSLTLSTTLALVWAYTQFNGGASALWSVLTLILYIFATTILFASVPWSKFSHMFFKPAAALEKKMSEASGSRNNLPEPADRTNPAVRDSHSMELLKDAPLSMGLGIKREKPSHY